MPQTFETFIEQERERLNKAREDALAARKEADDKLSAITTELEAIAAYEATKKGKKPRQTTLPLDGHKQRKPRETGKRIEVLNLVQTFPDGATSSELQDRLGIKGDKRAVTSLTNALSALKRDGKISLENGTYQAT